MVTSDEGWGGDWGPERKMNLVELCNSPEYWKGRITCEVHRVEHWSGEVEKRVLWRFFIPLFISILLGLNGVRYPAMVMFFAAFVWMGWTMIPFHNMRLKRQRAELRETHRAMRMTGRNLDDLLKDPLPGHLIIQKLSALQGDIPEDARKESIDRSDGMMHILVYMLFADDHDRVMFRLAAP